ncbi:MAG: S8 family serine peptidase [Phycisphaerales bacterium]|nr:S8 family serine peptidase [Phycisphaerales bacterium]MCI0675254.1 S8 family serine peptidase [Phycisphaerales bacterium]
MTHLPKACLLHLIAAQAALGAANQTYVPREILVRASPGRDDAARAAIENLRLTILETDAFSGVMRVRTNGDDDREDHYLEALNDLPEIAYAERNGIGHVGEIPNDTFFGLQWHLHNTGQSGGTPGADIQCVDAWDVFTGSSLIGVAVLDTGIQFNHPDLVGRIAANGWDFVNEDSDPAADHGHGTWVSGCIAANANNRFAVAGVDWACQIVPIKVVDQNGFGTTFDLAEALNYAASQANVHIVSMSLINYPNDSTLIDALQNARDAGKILIACAGNGGIGNADVSFPGASNLTMSIGFTTRQDLRHSNSATGNALDFVAPGTAIVTLAHGTSADTFATFTGCSFATPITSGVAALLLGAAQEAGVTLTHDDVYQLLQAGAEDQVGPASQDTPGWDAFFGHGRVNAYLSLLALPPACPADINLDEQVNVNDMLELISQWGQCPTGCTADIFPKGGSGAVDINDLLALIADWGPCP